MNDYKLMCHVSKNSTSIVITGHCVISADIC
jgi:hypothetical protein